VPPECARTSWQAWTGEVGAHQGEPIASTFWIQRDGCLFGRARMTLAQAVDWLDELDRQISSTEGSILLPEWPEASGRVRAALSPLRQMAPPGRVMPSTDDSNSRFILSLDRPTRGFLWTAERDE